MRPAKSCIHEPGPSDCPTPACFRRIVCESADEAWSLGKYTLVKTADGYFGDLVSRLKYADSGQVDKHASLTELVTQVSRFLALKNPAPFDGCVVVASNRSDSTPLMLHVARQLCILGRVHSLERLCKNGYIPVMKQTERSARARVIAGKYELAEDSAVPECSRILVLDDIYDSGATLAEAVATIRASAPKAHIVALTATYLRDPRES